MHGGGPVRLRAYGLTATAVRRAIRAPNEQVCALLASESKPESEAVQADGQGQDHDAAER
jgi:multidrug efflux pump subunit AcrB